MKILIVHGQTHQGSTYHIAHLLCQKLGGEVKEFFLPRDLNDYCLGCTTCFIKGEEHCPHYAKASVLAKAMDEADVIILASPVYVFHASAGMKNMLDHFGYRWMAHRPEESMFLKQAVCISTAAGMGMKTTNKDMGDSLFYWGISRIYHCGIAVAATSWNGVSEKKMREIERKVEAIAKKVKRRFGHVTPTMKGRLMFAIMRLFHKNDWNPKDQQYWEEKGWLGSARPWKRNK